MENVIKEKKVGIKDLLPYKSYLTLLFANIISRFGDSIDSVAYGLMVYHLTGSTLLLGTIFAVNAIPGVLFSAFSGVLVDYFSKKRVAIIGDIGRGLVVSLTAFLFLVNKLEPWHLFMFTFINSTIETFVMPAKMSLLQVFLPKELYLSASSFSRSATSFAEILGLGVAGVLIGLVGFSGAIFVDGLTFLISAVFISIIKVKNDNISRESLDFKTYTNDLREGFSFVKKEKLILMSILLFAFANFCLTPINVLLPAYVTDVLMLGSNGYSIMLMGFSIGMIIGGLVWAQIGSTFKKGYLVSIGLSAIGISYSLFSVTGTGYISFIPPLVLGALVFFLFGFFMPAATSPLTAYIMGNTPREIMGRVSGLMSVFILSAMPLGGAITGIVSEYIPITTIFLIMAIAMVVVSLMPLLNKSFRNA